MSIRSSVGSRSPRSSPPPASLCSGRQRTGRPTNCFGRSPRRSNRCAARPRDGEGDKLGVVKGLYVVAGVTMAGVSAVFVLLAELEDRYGLTKGGLGLIAGSAFAAALVTQLGLARYAD